MITNYNGEQDKKSSELSKSKYANDYRLISNPDELIPIFAYENKLYQDYFAWFLKYTNQKKQIWNWFSQELLPKISAREVLIDAGAGNGELLSQFLPEFSRCIAIEPNTDFTSVLRQLIPNEDLYQTTILNVPSSLPQANLVVQSHVKYYIPLEEWEINTERMISWLAPDGCLVEVLQSKDSDFQIMIAEFLGQEYVRELRQFAEQYDCTRKIKIEVETKDAWVSCPCLEMMLGVAIFMINNVPPHVLKNHPNLPTRKQLAKWIHQNYYSSKGIYQMSCGQDFVQYFLLQRLL